MYHVHYTYTERKQNKTKQTNKQTPKKEGKIQENESSKKRALYLRQFNC